MSKGRISLTIALVAMALIVAIEFLRGNGTDTITARVSAALSAADTQKRARWITPAAPAGCRPKTRARGGMIMISFPTCYPRRWEYTLPASGWHCEVSPDLLVRWHFAKSDGIWSAKDGAPDAKETSFLRYPITGAAPFALDVRMSGASLAAQWNVQTSEKAHGFWQSQKSWATIYCGARSK